jgi:hypothetical protein
MMNTAQPSMPNSEAKRLNVIAIRYQKFAVVLVL